MTKNTSESIDNYNIVVFSEKGGKIWSMIFIEFLKLRSLLVT